MTQLTLKAHQRNLHGRKVKSLRRNGVLPANIFGKKIKSHAIQVNASEFDKLYQEAGETNLINLKIENETKGRPVLIGNLQLDPVTDTPLHVDFHQVDLTEKVTVSIPIEVKGESSAVKEKGAVLITLLDEIKVDALPKDLPDQFVVDISNLREYDDTITVKDLGIDKSKLTLLVEETEPIVMVQEPKEEKEPAPAVVAEPIEEEKTKTEEEEIETKKTEESESEKEKQS